VAIVPSRIGSVRRKDPSELQVGIKAAVTRTASVSAPIALVQGRTRAMTVGAQPNQRLKLPAPVLSSAGLHNQ